MGHSTSSPAISSLILHGRHSVLPQHHSLAQGLLDVRSSTSVPPPHLSTNLTPGELVASPKESSLSSNLFLSLGSNVKGTKIGVSTTFIFSPFAGSFPPGVVTSAPLLLVFWADAGWSKSADILVPPLLDLN